MMNVEGACKDEIEHRIGTAARDECMKKEYQGSDAEEDQERSGLIISSS